MPLLWWLALLVAVAAILYLLWPDTRQRARDQALDILQRRYAAGEISTEQYEEQRARLERD